MLTVLATTEAEQRKLLILYSGSWLGLCEQGAANKERSLILVYNWDPLFNSFTTIFYKE